MTTTTTETPDLDSPRGYYGQSRIAHTTNLLAGASVATRSGLSTEIIRRMRRHYQVASSLTVQSLPLVRADWSIECTDERIRDELTEAYRSIAFDVHRTMTRALWAGFSPNTLTWSYREDLRGIFPVEVRDLEPFTCRPRTTNDGTLDGFVQGWGGEEEPFDPIYSLWIVEGMESGNYYGRSILEAALDPWADFAAIRAFHSRYLERFGEPVVVARAPSGKTIANKPQIEAAVAAGETPPDPIVEDNLDTALHTGENLRHHSVVALPSSLLFGADGKPTGYAWQLEFLESKGGGGTDFLDAMRELDKRIARAMFVPDLLIANTEDVGSNALGTSHRSVWSESVEGRLDDYSRQITRQILDPARILNYGDRAPAARLVFAPLANEAVDRLWKLVEVLASGGRLPVDVVELAEGLGIPLLADDEDDTAAADADLAASPFASVGLPALISSGIITRQEGRELLKIEGTVPKAIDLPAAVAAGEELTAEQRADVRASLGLPPDKPDTPNGPRVTETDRTPLRSRDDASLATGLDTHVPGDPGQRSDVPPAATYPVVRFASEDPVAGLPEWKIPQSYDPPPFRRELNSREQRVGFARLEDGLNRAEASVVERLDEILGREHDRVLRQLNGIVRKGTAAEILAALGTIEVKGGPEVSRAWSELMAEIGTLAVEGLRGELADYADKISDPGPDSRALFRAYAGNASERVLAQIVTETRSELLNAYTSGVSRAGMAAIVGTVFDAYSSSEGKGPRLTTRMLSSKSLNYSRAAAIERGGIPLAGAQYSAVLDRRTCELCEDLDERVIAIEHTDLGRFTPPIHHNCRCVWVWITRDEEDFTPTWSTPASSKVDRFGGLVI